MLKAAHHFKTSLIAAVFFLAALSVSVSPAFAKEIKTDETGLYADLFDQNIYYEGMNFFHLDRFYRYVTQQKIRSLDVNAFDEVPDSNFFTNRHARKRLSSDELTKGYSENSGPDFSGGMKILKGKFDGIHPGFFVEDSKGDRYLLKFDGEDSLELQTAAEIMASRFFYALGYNVPQYTIATFTMDQISIDPSATMYDDTGFKKKLTQEHLDQYLTFLPQDEEGRYRASASKILPGENKGVFRFHGRRRHDADDKIDHERLRAIRGLRVFGSWINDYDIRESNTLDMLVNENGKQTLKHYLIDFNDAFGSADGAKPPMFTHEHLIDYGEAGKSFFGLGFREKPWQKRWKEAGENLTNVSPAVGYFDNRYFRPETYKTQLPHYAFKDLTRADALWATKIIMTFTDADIRDMIKAGKFSRAEDAETIAKVIIERRDIIGKYWFGETTPLDDFTLQGNTLSFKDLGIEYKFWTGEQTTYKVKLRSVQGKKGSILSKTKINTTSVDLSSANNASVDVLIRAIRAGSSEKAAYVLVQIRDGRIAGIIHQD